MYKSRLDIFALALILLKILTFYFVTFRKYVKVTEYNFLDDAIRWQMIKINKILPHIFALSLIISEILIF